MLIAIIIVGFLVVGIIDLQLRKKYNIEKNVKFMDRSNKHRMILVNQQVCNNLYFLVTAG